MCRGDGAVVQVEIETPIDEDKLSSLECVNEWEQITESDDLHLYVIAFTAPMHSFRALVTAAPASIICTME